MKAESSFCSSKHSHSSNSSAKGSIIKPNNSSRESDDSYSEYSIKHDFAKGDINRNDSRSLPQPKPRDITVNITTIMGKVIPIQMQILGTIAQLKDLISEAAGISPESQLLVFCGKQLNDNNQTLKNLNIQDRSNLQLVLKMAGGL